MSRRVPVGWIAAVLLVTAGAFALRSYQLDAQALWADEGGSADIAAMGFGQLVRFVASEDPHPPLYYLLLKCWMVLAGGSDYALRFPSVLAATLAVPTLGGLARRAGGGAVGLVAALLLAASPLSVYYAQEARQYALLACLATLAMLRFRIALERGSWGAWLAFAAPLAVALYVHYFAAFLAAYAALLAYRTCLWRPDRWRALAAFALAGAVFLPWLMATSVLGYQGWMEHVTLEAALRRVVWAFAVGTTIYPEQGWTLAAPMLAAAALGALLLVARRRVGDLLLFGGWAVAPTLVAFAFGAATGRASFHERYVSLGAPGFLALAAFGTAGLVVLAGSLWRRSNRRAVLVRVAAGAATLVLGTLGVACGVSALAADARSLAWEFGDPHFAKENVRAATQFIEARFAPADAVVAAPGRFALYRHYRGPDLPMLKTDVVWDQARLERELLAITPTRGTLWMLPAGADVEREAERWLDARAYRLESRWFGLAPVMSWSVAPDPDSRSGAATLGPPDAPLFDVRDRGLALDDGSPSRLVRLVATWRKLRDTPALKESMRLVDGKGRVVAQVDRPLGGEVWPTDAWPTGTTATLRSALRVPPDLPAGRYSARLVVYGDAGPLVVRPVDGAPVGAEWLLGELDLAAAGPANPALVEPDRPLDVAMGGGLRLIGDDSGSASVVAGGKVTTTLHWQATTPEGFGPSGLGATELSLRAASPLAVDAPAALLRRLLGAGRASAAGSDVGTTPWVGPDAELTARAVRASGALLRDARTVAVPRDLPAGPYDLVLRWNGGAPVPLGRVEVQAAPPRPRPQSPQRPVGARLDGVTLAGLDLSGAAKPGATLELTLHWAAESAPDVDLSVFVHMVGPDGKIAAQHDGQPCGGACPTSGWASGDELLDSHPISLPTTLAPGRYRINVGLYDPRSGARLRRVDADADFVALTDLEVAP